VTNAAVILTGADVVRLLAPRDCIDAIAATLRAHEQSQSHGPVSAGLTLPGGSLHAKMAATHDAGRLFVVVKSNVNLPGNPERIGRPTIQGVLLLFDGDTGEPLAIIDSIAVTSLRTAAVAALAAEHLARQESRTIAIVGCGEQGEAQLRAMAVVRRLTDAQVFDVDKKKARAFADRMSNALGLRVDVAADLASAVRASDICVTCTTSKTPLLYPEHLHPGLFVAAVGADNPGKQEIDARALRQSRVVVDSLSACASSGDLHHAIEEGTMTEADVHGELSAVVDGRTPGRTSDDQIFIFDSTGTALQDVAAAVLIYRRALAAGVGMPVVLDDRG
jgi:ornithine cyclodeaminase/alanine dehydrogenase-like protein (mu-crystallin family)